MPPTARTDEQEYHTHLGELLSYARRHYTGPTGKERVLSLREVADKTGVSHSTVQRLELDGTHYVRTVTNLMRYCHALGIAWEDIEDAIALDAAKLAEADGG